MQAIIRYQPYLIEPASYTFWKHVFKDFENIILIKRNFMKVILVMNRFYNYCDNGDLFLKIFYKKAQLLFGNPFLWNLKISPWKKLYVLTLFYCYYGRLRELDIFWIIWCIS